MTMVGSVDQVLDYRPIAGIKAGDWDNPKLLPELEESRAKTKRAFVLAFERLWQQSGCGYGTCLEIGCGTGNLFRMIEGFIASHDIDWLQLEAHGGFITHAKSLSPEGQYVFGTVYNLPFPDDSIDVVCSLASYDTFMRLDRALKETARVLKPGGKFIHLLDVCPDLSPIAEDLAAAKIPHKVVESVDYKKFKSQIDEIYLYKELTEKQQARFDKKMQKIGLDDERSLDRLQKLEKKTSVPLDAHEYFEVKLVSCLKPHFKNIQTGEITGRFVGPAGECHRHKGVYWSFIRDVDTLKSRMRATELLTGRYSSLYPHVAKLFKLKPPDISEECVVSYATAEKAVGRPVGNKEA